MGQKTIQGAAIAVMVALAAGSAWAGGASGSWGTPTAGGSGVLIEVCELLLRAWDWLRLAGYIVAAISLGLISIQATATGRFPTGRFVSWAGVLFALSSAPLIIAFLTVGEVVALDCRV